MNKEQLNQWFLERSKREQIGIYILSFVLLYTLAFFIFIHPVNKARASVVIQQKEIQKQFETLQNQRIAILHILSDPYFQQAFQEQKKLQSQTQNLGNKLYEVTPNVLKPSDFPRIVEDILSIQSPIQLVNIKRLPIEPWIPKELEELSLPTYFATLFKYNLEIEFKTTYFNAIDYLQKIEKLPWHILWDSISYKVTTYPEANVIIGLHVLIEQKGET